MLPKEKKLILFYLNEAIANQYQVEYQIRDIRYRPTTRPEQKSCSSMLQELNDIFQNHEYFEFFV